MARGRRCCSPTAIRRPRRCGRARSDAFGKNYKLVTWDMRGHGQSDYPARPGGLQRRGHRRRHGRRCSMRSAPRQAIVGGLSLGGYMSLAFHRAHPGPRAGAADHRHRPRLQEGRGARGLEPDAADTAERYETRRPGRSARQRRARTGTPPRRRRAWPRAARGMLTQKDARVIESPAEHQGAVARDRRRRTTRRSSPPPTTWPPRSPARRRW